jgi:hypothetical protein
MDVIDADLPDTHEVIPLDGEQATEALAKLMYHLPLDVGPGRPFMATFNPYEQPVTFVTTVGLFTVNPASAERLVGIAMVGGELAELTLFCGGRETDRYAHRTSDLGRHSE